jgi:penicillin-binding protein 1A
VRYPERALKRRNLVLNEMLHDGKISQAQADAGKKVPLGLHLEAPANSVAPYFVEEVRRQLEKEFGVEEVHGAGLRVYTTLDLGLQQAANKAVLDGTAAYERRHGWSGKLPNIVLAGMDAETYKHPDWSQPMVKGSYVHGLVTDVTAKRVVVKLGEQQAILSPEDWAWTQNVNGDSFLRNGDLVYVRIEGSRPDGTLRATLQQDSGAQASLMAMDNATGEVVAMVGGRDFGLSQFNRATQAERQAGSSFKPYVYTTAFEAGAKPSDIVVDGPTTFPTPGGPYTPHNYEKNYVGPMTLLSAFAESRNIPALKLAYRYGIRNVIATAHRFGVTSDIPAFLPVAIGAADLTLYEQVGAYSVFPNDGIRVEPHFIRRVTQANGLPLNEKAPEINEVISVATAREMMQLLQAVTRSGTGASAGMMNHPFGGKTGTTNNYTDAWFIGFSPSVTCGTWVGFDNRQSLGEKETGARAALPIWMDFMRVAIANKPNEAFTTGGLPKKTSEVAAVSANQAVDAAHPNPKPVIPKAPAANAPTAKEDSAKKATAPAKFVEPQSFWVSKPPRGTK